MHMRNIAIDGQSEGQGGLRLDEASRRLEMNQMVLGVRRVLVTHCYAIETTNRITLACPRSKAIAR